MIMGVPYDAEVEYLESIGTQWIDTGIVMTTTLFETAKTTITVTPDESFGTHNFFGDGTSWYDGYTLGVVQYTKLQACNGYHAVQGETTSFLLNAPNVVEVSKMGILLNGNGIAPVLDSSKTSSGSLLLFGCRRNGVYFTTTPFSGKIHAAKMETPNGMVFDFIPVRVGQVGYMYDRVSKKLFGNQGTGSFVLGPDVATPVIGLRRYQQIGGAV